MAGGFDLNPKRTEITYDGSGDDKDLLIEWNKLLFRDGIGKAWALLVDYVKESCNPKRYYSLWPKDHEDEFDEYLLEGFFNEISEHECLKIKYKETASWKSPKENIFPDYVQISASLVI